VESVEGDSSGFLLVFRHTTTMTLPWTVFKDVSIPEAGRRQEQRRAAGGIGRLRALYYCYWIKDE
jgi:hypothetical protein